MAVLNLKDCTLAVVDGAAASIEIIVGEGNFTWDCNFSREYRKNRGKIGTANGGTVRDGDDEPMSVSFDVEFEEWTASGAVKTIREMLRNPAGDLTSTDADTCAPYACDLTVVHDQGCAAQTAETLTFPDFRVETIAGDLDAGVLKVSGKCNAVEPVSSND